MKGIRRLQIWNPAALWIFVAAVLLLPGSITFAQDTTPEMVDPDYVMPMPGQLVDVGDHSLHIYCRGEGSPTVILDAGAGDWSLFMLPLQEQVSEFTRACVYDRAGSGWSEPATGPVTARQVADDLEALLSNGGIEAPYLLVGHSYGGFGIRLYASEHPENVAGMVLVDARPSGTSDVERDLGSQLAAMLEQQTAVIGAYIDILRTTPMTPAEAAQLVPDDFVPPYLPPQLVLTYKQQIATLPYLESLLSLFENIALSEEQTADVDLGDIPLIVLVAAEPGESPLTPEEARAFHDAWIELQEAQAASSTNSEVRLIDDTGHYIYIDQPQVVTDAIRELVEAAR